jgi:hypothetical protein
MSFLDNYEPVADRIGKFWEKYPTGRIHTEIVLINEQEIVIKASIFTDREDSRATAIDFAQETRGSSNINKQSFVENCATSAIGRALATLNFQPKRDGKAVRPSREEMTKTVPSKQSARNWASEATVLAGLKDVEGLRKLHTEAKSQGASEEMLKSITDLGKSLK